MGGPQRFCTECGHELRPGTRFCTTCGHTAAVGGQPAAQAGADNSNRDFRAATTMPAPPRRDASRRPWPQPEPPRPPDEIGPASAGPEAAGPGPLPQADDQLPDQFRPDEFRPEPPHPNRPRSRLLLVTSLVVLAAAAIAAAILIFHPVGRHAPAPAPTKPPTPAFTSSPPSPTPTSGSLSAQQQAADGLAALLNNSAGDRNSVNGAFRDVMQCGPNLDQDAQIFRSSATSRQRLLQQLAVLPSRSALPGPMLQDLTSAWQASVAADQDFAAWAQDEVSGGCVPNQPDPHFQAANGPDLRATADKKAFLRLWNRLAARYSLATYQQNEL